MSYLESYRLFRLKLSSVERHHVDRGLALQAYESQFELQRPYFTKEFEG